MKKSNHFLFTSKDEEVFSTQVRELFPATMFIDDMVWDTNVPPAKSSITECQSKFVYIWNAEIYPNLPCEQRKDGKFQGPQSGMVIQFIRSRFEDKATLLSGSISIGITIDRPQVEQMVNYVKQVWKILKKVTPKKLVQVNPETKEILFKRSDIVVGNYAYEWCKEKEERFLKFNNSNLIYLKPL